MRQHHFVSIFMILLLFFSCKNDNKELDNNEALEAMGKFTGTWQLQPKLKSYEHWEHVNNGFIGKDFHITDGDTVLTTVYFIEPQGDSIRLQVQPIDFSGEGKNATINYKLTSANSQRFVFTNPNHNFPKTMTFSFQRNGREIALYLEGMLNGQVQQADLLYKKITS